MISSILRGSFELYRRFAVRFISTALVVFVVMDLIAALADSAAREGSGLAAAFWSLLSLLVWLVGSFWVQGALVEAVRDVRDGKVDTTLGQLFQQAKPRLPALIVAGVLAGLGVALGLFLLVLPGLFLLTRWAVIVPVIMIEKKGAAEAFGRSNALVRGFGWDVFGLIVITLLASAIAQGVLTSIFIWLPRFLSVWLGNLIAHSVVIPFVAIAWTLLYFELAEKRPVSVVREPTPPPSPPAAPPPIQPPTPQVP